MSLLGNLLTSANSVASLGQSAANLVNGTPSVATPKQSGILLGSLVTNDFFVFQNFEVPEKAPFGGDQSLAVHKLVGGTRVIDAMGRDDRDISWSGLFLSPDADVRARRLDQFRVLGQPMQLVWGEHRYNVLIKTFAPDYQQANRVPYSISFTVLLDKTTAVPTSEPSPDEQAVSDVNHATTLTSVLDDLGADISAAMPYINFVQKTISTVNGITGLSIPQLNAIQSNIASAQSVLSPLTLGANGALASLTTLGGILTNVSGPANSGAITSAANTAQQLPNLLDLQATLNRLSRNVGLVGP